MMHCSLQALRGMGNEEQPNFQFKVLGQAFGQTVEVTQDNLPLLAPHLTTVKLPNRELTEIPPVIFTLTKLSRLDLSGNFIRSIPQEILKLKNLEVLDLSHNQISHFPPIPENLKQLYVADNQIESLPVLAESKLQVLDLSNNPIDQLEETLNGIQVIFRKTN